jgi:hypothetical protein
MEHLGFQNGLVGEENGTSLFGTSSGKANYREVEEDAEPAATVPISRQFET